MPRLQFTTEPVAIGYVELYGAAAGAKVTATLEARRTLNGPALVAVPLAIEAAGKDRYIAKGAVPIGAAPARRLHRPRAGGARRAPDDASRADAEESPCGEIESIPNPKLQTPKYSRRRIVIAHSHNRLLLSVADQGCDDVHQLGGLLDHGILSRRQEAVCRKTREAKSRLLEFA